MFKHIDRLMKLEGFAGQVVEATIFLVVGLILIKSILILEKRLLKKTNVDKALHLFFLKATKVILNIILAITVLQSLGVSTSSLLALLGTAGVAIALALKDSLGNVAGGIIIILTRPFKSGDIIELSGSSNIVGIVDNIDLLTTKMHTPDNKALTVPNGHITTSVIVNYSHSHIRRVDCQFGVDYSCNLKEAKDILTKVAHSSPLVLKEPDLVVGVASQGDSAIIIDLKVWCKTEDYFQVKYYLEEAVKEAFDKAGISIPFPQMDVHIIS